TAGRASVIARMCVSSSLIEDRSTRSRSVARSDDIVMTTGLKVRPIHRCDQRIRESVTFRVLDQRKRPFPVEPKRASDLRKWWRGRDLNPWPSGYERIGHVVRQLDGTTRAPVAWDHF